MVVINTKFQGRMKLQTLFFVSPWSFNPLQLKWRGLMVMLIPQKKQSFCQLDYQYD